MKQHAEGALPERITLNREIAAAYGAPLVMAERTDDEYRRCRALTQGTPYRAARQCMAKARRGDVYCFAHCNRPVTGRRPR